MSTLSRLELRALVVASGVVLLGSKAESRLAAGHHGSSVKPGLARSLPVMPGY
jgi:hypothetical protein